MALSTCFSKPELVTTFGALIITLPLFYNALKMKPLDSYERYELLNPFFALAVILRNASEEKDGLPEVFNTWHAWLNLFGNLVVWTLVYLYFDCVIPVG